MAARDLIFCKDNISFTSFWGFYRWYHRKDSTARVDSELFGRFIFRRFVLSNFNWGGKLFCYYDETEMVGYAIFIVADSVHSMGLMQATCTVMYVKPEYRKGGAGARFIYNCQKDLLEMGADVMIMAVKPIRQFGKQSFEEAVEIIIDPKSQNGRGHKS